MLRVTPQTLKMLRARRKTTRKLKQERRKRIVTAIATVMRQDLADGHVPTLLNHEATIRASLRAGLCLESWPWREAHDEACAILEESFKAVGAKRPTWQQGQPEWTEGGIVRSERVRCANCERPLDEGRRIFCSHLCYDAHHARQRYHDDADAARAVQRLNELSHG